MESLQATLPERMVQIRARLEASGVEHGRVAESAAKLCVAVWVYLETAVAVGALAPSQRPALEETAIRALLHVARQTAARQAESRPSAVFREILHALLVQTRVYLAGRDDQAPSGEPERWGWLLGADGLPTTRPIADKIGWIDEEEEIVYLLPAATFKAVAA